VRRRSSTSPLRPRASPAPSPPRSASSTSCEPCGWSVHGCRAHCRGALAAGTRCASSRSMATGSVAPSLPACPACGSAGASSRTLKGSMRVLTTAPFPSPQVRPHELSRATPATPQLASCRSCTGRHQPLRLSAAGGAASAVQAVSGLPRGGRQSNPRAVHDGHAGAQARWRTRRQQAAPGASSGWAWGRDVIIKLRIRFA